jgi:hypothetical protein
VFAYIPNFDSWKGNILFVIMAIYWTGMIVFNFRRRIRIEKKEKSEQRIRDLEEKHKELDMQERIYKINQFNSIK